MGALERIRRFVGLFLLSPARLCRVQGVLCEPQARAASCSSRSPWAACTFSALPRGYLDGFWNWGKQVAGLCLTAFLQTTMLTAGLMVWNTNMLLGCGMMLASTEVPRIAGAFGVDTSTRANVMGAVHTAQSVINTVRMVSSAPG